MARRTQPEISLEDGASAETHARVSAFLQAVRANPGAMVEVLCGVERPDLVISHADDFRPDGTPKSDALAAAVAVAANRDNRFFDYDLPTEQAVRVYVKENRNLRPDELALGRLCVVAQEQLMYQETLEQMRPLPAPSAMPAPAGLPQAA